jgi:hypothetical protein
MTYVYLAGLGVAWRWNGRPLGRGRRLSCPCRTKTLALERNGCGQRERAGSMGTRCWQILPLARVSLVSRHVSGEVQDDVTTQCGGHMTSEPGAPDAGIDHWT